MGFKQIIKLRKELEIKQKQKVLTTDEQELLAELTYLKQQGITNERIEIGESVSVGGNSCSACGRPY